LVPCCTDAVLSQEPPTTFPSNLVLPPSSPKCWRRRTEALSGGPFMLLPKGVALAPPALPRDSGGMGWDDAIFLE